jgi:hypothetical protein
MGTGIAHGVSCLELVAVMIMLFNLKQRGNETKNTGVSARSLLLFAIAGCAVHAEMFWNSETASAVQIAIKSAKDPKVGATNVRLCV